MDEEHAETYDAENDLFLNSVTKKDQTEFNPVKNNISPINELRKQELVIQEEPEAENSPRE
jgi:hypothetical protein